ncbi:MAG TPA: hypothetical protein VKX46_17965 [Ktedonobacteraceae bacterium]|nr:hypothetical protein [Ktedonobacteraceae bacterium]
MSALMFALASGSGGTRTLLFVLLIVALALILAGAIIAVVTLYTYRRNQSSQ